MLTIENLKYTYNINSSDYDINCDYFHANKGEIICFAGNDRSAKTIFAQLIAGVRTTLEGKIDIENISTVKNDELFKKSIGYLPVENIFYPELSFMEYLNFINSSYGYSKKYLAVKINWFSNYIDIKQLNLLKSKSSQGNKLYQQKIKIFTSLLHNPKLLVLDEPYLNLDLQSISKLNEILSMLAKDHLVTVLIINTLENENEIEAIKNISSKFIFITPNKNIGKEYNTKEIQKSANERDLTFTKMIGKYV